MKYFTIILLLLLSLSAFGSTLEIRQDKTINGGYVYSLPRLELNQSKFAGKFLGTPCLYVSKFEGELLYTASRGNALGLNHHSIKGNWNLGIELKPIFITYSLGAQYFIKDNDDKIPEGFDLLNSFRCGLEF